MCRCGGFGGGGGGGGTGNLSGTLTTPAVPYATGAHTLGDSPLSRLGAALMDLAGKLGLDDLVIRKSSRSVPQSMPADVAGVIDLPTNAYNFYTLVLTKNITVQDTAGTADPGRGLVMRIGQDGVGGWTLGFSAFFRFSGGVAPVVSPTALAYSYFYFLYNEVDDVWDEVGERLDFV